MSFRDEIGAWQMKFEDAKKKEAQNKAESEILARDFQAFLRRIGLPETFTLADAMDLSIKKAND